MSAQAQPHPLGGSIPRSSTWTVILIGAALAIAVGSLFAAGTLPRLRRQAGLTRQAQQARSAVPGVQVVTPHLVSDTGLTLPGTIQAFRDTVINARTTGYLSRLYVDIGSQVKEGQLLAEIASPDMDQQLYQAQAQTAQSRAAVSQSQATVAQQQATVSQNLATVTQQQAAVQQAYAQVESFRSAVIQAQATEKAAEATVMFKKHALAEAQATRR